MSLSSVTGIVFIVLVASFFTAILTSVLHFALLDWLSSKGSSSTSVRQVLQRIKRSTEATFSSWRTRWQRTIAKLWKWLTSWASYLRDIRLERRSYSSLTGPGTSR